MPFSNEDLHTPVLQKTSIRKTQGGHNKIVPRVCVGDSDPVSPETTWIPGAILDTYTWQLRIYERSELDAVTHRSLYYLRKGHALLLRWVKWRSCAEKENPAGFVPRFFVLDSGESRGPVMNVEIPCPHRCVPRKLLHPWTSSAVGATFTVRTGCGVMNAI